MHPLSFAAKRVHLRTVAFGQWLVRKVTGMTPARFDLLFVIYRSKDSDPVFPDRDPLLVRRGISGIARELGLHRTTISKMAKRLVEMGWLNRWRSERDVRSVGLGLTSDGLKALMGAIQRAVSTMVTETRRCFAREASPEKSVGAIVAAVVAVWWRVGRFFWDRSQMPYGPDPLAPVQRAAP